MSEPLAKYSEQRVADQLRELLSTYGEAELTRGLGVFLADWLTNADQDDPQSGLLRALAQATTIDTVHEVVHEMRSLLSAVIANCEVADSLVRERARLGPRERVELAECVADARLAADRAVGLSADISRVRRKVRRRATQLDECVARAGRLARQSLSLGRYRAELEVDAAAPVQVGADPGELLQVLLNLTRNALEAVTEREGGRVKIRSWYSQTMAYVSVEDNGEGFDADQIENIFQPFYTTKAEGTGIGLYICRRLVDGWGGQLEVRARQGEGATFIVGAPLVG
ncbi:MAG: sensor histidine kinase [Myxococcales bacterium]|nr:sensor histidine kinase [Myxococcales bacterium]